MKIKFRRIKRTVPKEWHRWWPLSFYIHMYTCAPAHTYTYTRGHLHREAHTHGHTHTQHTQTKDRLHEGRRGLQWNTADVTGGQEDTKNQDICRECYYETHTHGDWHATTVRFRDGGLRSWRGPRTTSHQQKPGQTPDTTDTLPSDPHLQKWEETPLFHKKDHRLPIKYVLSLPAVTLKR